MKVNGNQNTTDQNLWDTAEVVLRGQFIELNAYIRNKMTNQSFKFLPYEMRKNERKAK